MSPLQQKIKLHTCLALLVIVQKPLLLFGVQQVLIITAEHNTINAVVRKYREVGFRFGITEVSGGSINDSTRVIEFNVDPGLTSWYKIRSGRSVRTHLDRGETLGILTLISCTYLKFLSLRLLSEYRLLLLKLMTLRATADTFEHYFGSSRATSFTLAIKGGSNKPRTDGKTCGIVWPQNWIFPYRENPVLTTGLDVYQFYSLGKKDAEKRTVWYGVPLKSSSGTDIFFPTY